MTDANPVVGEAAADSASRAGDLIPRFKRVFGSILAPAESSRPFCRLACGRGVVFREATGWEPILISMW